MKSQLSSTKFYKRWFNHKSWLNRASKCTALVRGGFNYFPVQSLPDVNIQLPLSTHRHFWSGLHKDKHLLQFLREAIPTDGVFFDIGANVGLYSTTMWLAKDEKIKISAFEPISSTVAELRKTFALNKVDARIESVALSSEAGELVLSAYEQGANNFWIKNPEGNNSPTISVPKMRLDDWCVRNPDWIPNAMKIDVEGHELEVLKGAQQILKTHKPALVVECHCASWADLEISPTEFIKFIHSLGYAKLHDAYGRTINFETQASTIHLLCSP
ncbi:FkbM family methyltransferase [Oxynema sp. CENA135]|uniref:FkbM family methyltransferase n=1 Tax=Oxynema sp. CENA135 TaxID=984206 RepID=UPI00190AC389|nr:FkbM family methyltransferase [Oxynema sp. CENA135]MBK4728700.1 FkbM family methyltransferase [Oxynema sp. CENA135]